MMPEAPRFTVGQYDGRWCIIDAEEPHEVAMWGSDDEYDKKYTHRWAKNMNDKPDIRSELEWTRITG